MAMLLSDHQQGAHPGLMALAAHHQIHSAAPLQPIADQEKGGPMLPHQGEPLGGGGRRTQDPGRSPHQQSDVGPAPEAEQKPHPP